MLLPLFPDPMALESNLLNHKYLPKCFLEYVDDWFISAQFLINYKYAYETFKSYRRDVERLLLWSWEQNISLNKIQVIHLQQYIDFVKNVPQKWIMSSHMRRYLDEDAAIANPAWRPCIRRDGEFNIKSMLAILSSFFNYLVDHDYIHKNPIKLLKQKRHLTNAKDIRVIRKLSDAQWQYVINSCALLKEESQEEMRNWWMLGLFYLLGLRISELSVTVRHSPGMRDFYKDEYGQWWLKVIGKNNKFREIAVPLDLIAMMKVYRKSCGLTEHILVNENTPLLGKLKGHGGIGVRQVRFCVEHCFTRAADLMRMEGKHEDAINLEQATVHWLRHTSISNAVKYRPIEHVRDDAGHSSITITDIYIDSDRMERHKSAQKKKLIDS